MHFSKCRTFFFLLATDDDKWTEGVTVFAIVGAQPAETKERYFLLCIQSYFFFFYCQDVDEGRRLVPLVDGMAGLLNRPTILENY